MDNFTLTFVRQLYDLEQWFFLKTGKDLNLSDLRMAVGHMRLVRSPKVGPA